MPLQTTSALQDKEKWSTRLITFFQAWSDQMSQVFGVVKIFQLKFLLNYLNRQWCRSRKSDRSRNLWSLLTSCGLRSRLWAAHLDWSRCSPDKTETKLIVTWVPNNLLGGVNASQVCRDYGKYWTQAECLKTHPNKNYSDAKPFSRLSINWIPMPLSELPPAVVKQTGLVAKTTA